MLDADTKRRIDTARDILVGKVPDPKSQVEQITIALIYKFMDDMDAQSEELGGKRDFFADGFARYGWAKLMRAGLGGHDTLNLYADAITRMPENPGIPPLFRDIFKNAYLPYRDPETLRAFLKIIDEFTYDHSERLGDAFEYLLSVLGSQGDAGQFRTPRHIIDFIVEVVDPKKDEKILDPACGTAGFLISAYKHILQANTDYNGGSALTSEEQTRLAAGLKGYDISPDMVRLSLANMYLHGFTDPHISEYDTLTSEDNWNEFADVILANPPFMSPKGGIRPHNRFSVKSKRSEVLFVDYMAGHLGPAGRAGIIVPEGIIFQSQNAYKQLRKMLVDEYLVAVVSLPAGVFNPYAGVKTSILILDKPLAKRANHVAFFKIGNDGYGLGAQRREIDKNDLPGVKAEIAEYLRLLRAGESLGDFEPTLGLIVAKEKIAKNGEYNLSGERYRESKVRSKTKWPVVELEELLRESKEPDNEKNIGKRLTVSLWHKGVFKRHLKEELSDKTEHTKYFIRRKGQFIYGKQNLIRGAFGIIPDDLDGYCSSSDVPTFDFFTDRLLPTFLDVTLTSRYTDFAQFERGAGSKRIAVSDFLKFLIPLPPLDIQKEIVAEIEGYQKVIDGARAVVDNYRPHIAVDPEWPMVALEEACEIKRGKFSHRPRNEPRFYGGKYPFIQTGDVARAVGGTLSYTQTLNDEGLSISRLFQPPVVVVTIAANIGETAVLDFPSCFPDSIIGLIPHSGTDAWFLEFMMRSEKQHLNEIAPQAAQKNINIEILKTLKIPLPTLKIQQAIVAEIEAEQVLVDANRKLIDRFEKKIQAVIARVWGEDA